ncbi:MAG: glycosyl transferase [Thermosynechococcaceae cyanobacterium]
MSRPTLYAAITNHGFGHATRTAAVLAEVQRQCPDVLLILATSAPRWLLESYLPGDFIYRPCTVDVGAVQSDGFTINKAATLQQLQQLRTNENRLIAAEVTFIRQNRVNLIFADIPPLMTKIAEAAGIPCWMSSNFGWDLIYQDWGSEFTAIVDWVQDCFSRCDRLFRLPFSEPMSAFSNFTDVGLTGASPQVAAEDLRSKFHLEAAPGQTILLTFGGMGLSKVPYHHLSQFPDWQFITFDEASPSVPNLLKVPRDHYRPVDFMPLCGRVVSKPGYGTFAEACRLQIPVASLPRLDFAEAPFLISDLQKHSHHQILASGEFEQSWDFLHQSPLMPLSNQPFRTDGNETIAKAIVEYLVEI